jgi:DNA-binding SARP family transcriptional activator
MGGDHADAGLVVALLGPVEIGPAGGTMTPVAQSRLRVLLGLLGVARGRVVTAEALVDGVWGEEWSPGREKNLHALVYQLRRRLAVLEPEAGPRRGGARLARAGTGYRLVLGPGELDVDVFRDVTGRAREAARAGDAAGARELFGQALGLWRGAALADTAPLCLRLAGEAARLEEARLAVVEERIGADLALGRHREVAGELAGLVEEFPLRERLTVLLMTALYRCGRRGEALAVFDAARRVLAEELGLDPGPELAGLQAQVLADDPTLAAPAAVPGGAALTGAEGAARAMVPRQLPAGAAFFAGREAELKQLDALLDQAAGESGADEPGGAVVISAVAGMAGVGKTALAVHWARTVAGRFPDGQLYVNLRGYDAGGAAVTAEEVTGWFLAALAAAQADGDQDALGWIHATIGRYGSFSGAADDGRAHQQLALDHFQRAGDLVGQGWAHMFTGLACTWNGGWAEAARQCGTALALFRQAGQRYGEGWALAGLGECHARLGNYDLARGYARQALEAGPATGDPTTSAFAWHALGFVHARLGEPHRAITCYQQALALVRERKYPLARMLLVRLLAESGDACRSAADLPAAAEAWQQALQVLHDLGWPDLLGVRARLDQAGRPSPPA